MTDEVAAVDEVQPEPATPAEAQNTDTDAGEHMIPKSRFDEVNKQLKELRKAQETAAKEAEALKRQQAEEQGKFKELYEAAQAELAAAKDAAKAAELARVKSEVAAKHSLPAALVDRLRGETAEELEADALALLEALPKSQPVTRTDSAAGVNGKTPTPPPDDRQIMEMAARLGVSFEHLKKQYV